MSDEVDVSKIPSKPYFSGFNPKVIRGQMQAFGILENFDYKNQGVCELMLSGALGSSKSMFMSFYVILHCLTYPGARAAICRRAMPALRKTIYLECIQMLEGDTQLKEGVHWTRNQTTCGIKFRNGSEIIAVSWSDSRPEKVRSLKLSLVAIEEITESESDKEIIVSNLLPRLERIAHVPQNIFICATNPSSEESWLYDYFIKGSEKYDNRFVVYSKTRDNPFLPKTYIPRLLKQYTKLEAMRFLEGLWISLKGEGIYSSYDPAYNFRNYEYEIDRRYPIIITADFNISEGKPMSFALGQLVNDTFHWFEESVIHSARTEDTMEDLELRGLISTDYTYIVCGDAAGKHRDTRSKRSDYDIIYQHLERKGITFEKAVPRANPALRKRHNRVNTYCCNSLNHHRLFIYEKAPTLAKGMRLTKLKEGAGYIENDRDEWQHATTALGYAVVFLTDRNSRKTTQH
jgi:hypothetical protein